MKMTKKLLALLVVAFAAVCCQDDTDSETTEALKSGSDLTAVLKAMSVNETSADNAIDSTSCFKIKLPFKVVVNGQAMTIVSEDDYSNVATVLNAGDTNENTVSIVFPIKVEEPDYTEISVRSSQQFKNLKATCEQVAANYISDNCTEILFPVTIYSYNSGFQMQGNSVINDNKELYTAIKNLGPDEYYSVGYPVSLKVSEGIVKVNSNSELLQAISSSVISCQ